MKHKIGALMAIVLMLTLAAAGCLGGEEDATGSDATREPKLEMGRGTVPQESGWAERQSGDVAHVSIPYNFPHSMVTKVSFRIMVEDSDPEHSETDEGSDPDDITVAVKWGNITDKKGPMPTPASFNFEIVAPPGEYLPSSGSVDIDGKLNGGKPAIVFGLIVYVDQGFAYKVDAEYTYMREV